MGKPRGRNGREQMSQSVGSERVSTDLANGPGGHEDDRGVNHSAQRSQMPLFPGERSGQPGEQRHIPDWIDRRPKSREVFANLDEERRHVSNVLSERQICFHFIIHPSYFLLLVWPYTNGGSSARQS